jgi:hypothetical protein
MKLSVDCIEPFYLLSKETGMEAYKGRGNTYSQILRFTVNGILLQYTYGGQGDGWE